MAKLLAKCADQLQPSLQLLSSNKFFWSIDRTQIQPLLDLLTTQQHEPIRLAIISILLLKFPQQLSIQDCKGLSEELVKLLKTSNYKKVVAALLVRLPNYTSYKQVLQHLEPKLTPVGKMLQLSTRLKESSNALYEKQIGKYRVEWCALSATTELNLQPLEDIYNQLTNVTNLQNIDGFELETNLERQTNYLLERISILGTQKIDFTKICASLEKLIAGVPYQLTDLKEQLRDSVGELRQNLKISGLLVLNEMLSKLQRKFIRKYSWLLLVHDYCMSSPSSEKFVTLSLQLTLNILQVFGNGSLKLKELLFTAQHSLYNLLTFLFRRKPVSTSKEQMHFRRDKHPNRPKQVKPSLDLNEPNKIFQQGLTNITKQDQSQIILKVLEIFKIYYSKPHDSTCQNTAQLLQLIDLNEIKLTPLTTEIYKQIKNLIMPQSVVFSGDVDGIYQELWAEKAKRKKMKQSIVKTIDISIKSQRKDKEDKPILKRAISEDMNMTPERQHQIEGWGTPTKKHEQPKPKGDSQPSEMFYSFHDSRFSRTNQQMSASIPKPPHIPLPQSVDDFILTPSFE